jgi:hypothetical protein
MTTAPYTPPAEHFPKQWRLIVLHGIVESARFVPGREVGWDQVVEAIEELVPGIDWNAYGTCRNGTNPNYSKGVRAVTLTAGVLKQEGLIECPRRRYYTPTQAGIELIKGNMPYQDESTPHATDTVPEPEVVVPELPAIETLTIEAVNEGLCWLPPVERSQQVVEDTYLHRLQVESTRCYGHFSSRSKSCESCPLLEACKAAVITTMASLLEAADAAFERGLQEQARGDMPAPTLPVVDQQEQEEAAAEASAETPLPAGATEIPAYFDSPCSGCGAIITKGQDAIHIPGRGLFHKGCN